MSASDHDPAEPISWRRRAGTHHQVLALSVIASAAAVLVATAMAGGVEPLVVLGLTPLLVWCALVPDSDLGLLAIIALAVQWLMVVEGDARTGPWLLVAALGMLLFHSTMAASTVAPPGATWSGTMVRRWSVRVGVVAALTCGAWLSAVVLGGGLTHDGLLSGDRRGSALVLVLALVGTAATAWSIRARSLRDH